MQIFPGTENLVIRYTTKQDISDATLLRFKVRLPDATELDWDATLHGDDALEYATQEGDLDQVGAYIIHPYIELEDGFKGYGLPFTLRVSALFKQ